MRLNKILIMGLVSMSIMGTANAAVYGTLNNDVEIKTLQDTSMSKDTFISGDTIVALQKGELIKIVSKEDEGYIIDLGSDTEQRVDIETVDLIGKLTYALVDDTKLRETASPDSDIIGFLKEGELVLVEERQDDFYKVKVNDQEGYIYKTQMSEQGLEELPYTKTETAEVSRVKQGAKEDAYRGEEVVAYAKQFLGGRYVYGGTSLQNGVDCSGFSQQIMKYFGVRIERSSRSQYAANGYSVSENEILPGDLVFYGTNGKHINHVAIYAGNGKIIHASDERSGIKMSSLHYGKPLIGIKRVLN